MKRGFNTIATRTASRANNRYSPGSDKLTEVQLYINQLITAAQLYMSTSCQLGSRVIRAVPDVEKAFFNFAIKAAKSENKKKMLFAVREDSDKHPDKRPPGE